MRLWQNAIALVGTVLAAGALLPLPSRVRLTLVAAAIAAIVGALFARIRAHTTAGAQRRVSNVYGRIERIRAERAQRRSRPRRS